MASGSLGHGRTGQRKDRITLKPRRSNGLIALVSGGDFAGAGAALKELRVTGNRFGLDVHFVRHGFLGLANNWIDSVTEAGHARHEQPCEQPHRQQPI